MEKEDWGDVNWEKRRERRREVKRDRRGEEMTGESEEERGEVKWKKRESETKIKENLKSKKCKITIVGIPGSKISAHCYH